MLTLLVPRTELYDELNNKFIVSPEQELVLEHSLKAISKWEQKYHKAFAGDKKEKTPEESIYYVRCMTVTENVNLNVYNCINNRLMEEIIDYIEDPYSAYKIFSKENTYRYGSITAEAIYYRMIVYGIPFTCEDWNFNSLLALIAYCADHSEDGSQKKMSMPELARFNSKLNAERRRVLNTKG